MTSPWRWRKVVQASPIPNVIKGTAPLNEKEIYLLLYQERREVGSGTQIYYQSGVTLSLFVFPSQRFLLFAKYVNHQELLILPLLQIR